MASDDDLLAILGALELPPHARERWLAELGEFCRDHGGERRYRELMTLLRECREVDA